ncbi:hypothetical protein [Anaeromyxobacter sp. Fw109-5]|uniref:hypothetical protein n=1 Tax=Anaeromyxobacter sp. (strain Fw109-5) TaxID=404589 RepID=UPI0000ED6D03|nr:hypothetical protein [Anaeromyxobacter sp. Fw109-5]ABS28000.1 hypothetical protein Anae109_3821 [Anaeromyxobacter sp. Fw109-5]
MGFLSSVFGEKKDTHPALDRDSVAGRRIAQRQLELESFVRKVKDRIELVPAQDATYVFIGKPPGSFGVAWLADGREQSMKTLMQERGLSAANVQILSDQLRDVYSAHMNEERYQADIAGKSVLVTPSDALAADVRRIVDAVAK